MSDTLHIRASSTDRAWSCTESLRSGDGPLVDPAGEAAELGSAFHEWSRTRDTADLEEIATRYGVDREELERLVAYACVAERDLRKWFGDAARERALQYREPWDCAPYDSIELTGSVDRAEVLGERGAILDYKTGLVESGYEHQQRCYAFLLMRAEPEITEVQSAIAYVQHGYWRGRTYKVADLEAWWHDFKRRLANGINKFAPGPHCGFCPRRPTCPGVEAYNRSALAAVVDEGPLFDGSLTIENKEIEGPFVAERRRKVAYIKQRCDEFLSVLRTRVQEIGDVPAGDGLVLKIVTQHRRVLDAQKAWPVLSQQLSEDQIAEACSISISKCQDLVAAGAERGMKGTARQQLAEELDKAGALSTKPVEQLREVAE